MSALQDLLELVPPPPAHGHVEVDWNLVEVEMGLRLTSDYKSLVDIYGAGQFDRFLTVYQPVTPFLNTELAYRARRQNEILAQLRDGGREHIPFTEGTLLPVAGTDNGDTIYWVLEPSADPDAWTITADEARNRVWPRFPGGITDFLHAVLSRRTRFPIFPKDFPSRNPRFKPRGEPDPKWVARLRTQGLYRDL
ncbi:hypothetical protein [Catenuloplanes atrovinosus]|uniref:SMI1/KNR4 family protein n=1 Tax=Catenuloplanes atrovinosus TaxID=137266 RepID=A0AAE3YRW7_9ACTN|nr:hypothetical protein [Catenuloplanes atrovinosus]MDR7278510.1 hypothetical protein [Catenuloplanes atrovinosus]